MTWYLHDYIMTTSWVHHDTSSSWQHHVLWVVHHDIHVFIMHSTYVHYMHSIYVHTVLYAIYAMYMHYTDYMTCADIMTSSVMTPWSWPPSHEYIFRHVDHGMYRIWPHIWCVHTLWICPNIGYIPSLVGTSWHLVILVV